MANCDILVTDQELQVMQRITPYHVWIAPLQNGNDPDEQKHRLLNDAKRKHVVCYMKYVCDIYAYTLLTF